MPGLATTPAVDPTITQMYLLYYVLSEKNEFSPFTSDLGCFGLEATLVLL